MRMFNVGFKKKIILEDIVNKCASSPLLLQILKILLKI